MKNVFTLAISQLYRHNQFVARYGLIVVNEVNRKRHHPLNASVFAVAQTVFAGSVGIEGMEAVMLWLQAILKKLLLQSHVVLGFSAIMIASISDAEYGTTCALSGEDIDSILARTLAKRYGYLVDFVDRYWNCNGKIVLTDDKF